MGTYLNEDGSEGDTFHDACEAVAVEEQRTHLVMLTNAELLLLAEALDSHKYWQLAEPEERDSGFVYLHADDSDPNCPDETCPEDCTDERHAEIRTCEKLGGRLEALTKKAAEWMRHHRVNYEADDGTWSADAYQVTGHPGVAWYVLGWETEPGNPESYDEETGEIFFDEEPEAIQTGRVVCVMVGDDVRWTFDPSEVEPLAREAYCGVCGQMGCRHDGLPREDEEDDTTAGNTEGPAV